MALYQLWDRVVRREVHDRSARSAAEEAPLRAQLLSQAQLESHARSLAIGHQSVESRGPDLLLPRLRQNERVIRECYEVVSQAVRLGRRPAPAAEWLLDNFFLIQDQIDIAREYLPARYSRQLPRLKKGALRGYPRVYELALELVSHTDGRVDMDNLGTFVGAYQTAAPLKLGELWAVPIMVRLALLENLRRVAYRIAQRRRDRDEALEWAERFRAVLHRRPKALIVELAEFVRAKPVMRQAFIAELVTSLHAEHPAVQMVTNLIEQDLHELGQTIEQVLQAESSDQAADQVSLSNSITSLRTLSGIDWPEFVESLSVTEAVLRRDPLGAYAGMNFRTRDKYRHVVERLARRRRLGEPEVAEKAVHLATERLARRGGDRREGHVGWFLIDRGLLDLEEALNHRPNLWRRLGRAMRRHALATYVGMVAVLTAGLATLMLALGATGGWPWYALAGVGLGLTIVASQAAISLVNWLLTRLLPSWGLPRMDFAKGVPDEHRTAVAVPTLLTAQDAVESLLESLAIRHLANRDPNILFALLTDFTDAPQQTMPGDPELLEQAAEGIARLNERYAADRPDLFFLLHRPREWNAQEGVWMGRERKRGKLLDFNRLLRASGGAEPNRFSRIVGDPARLQTVRYVISLDSDTQLPPASARRLIGAMAHPLNRPRIDPSTGCVVAGYAVLQPRVAISLTSAARSLFARMFSGEVGLDPYTREVSNAYQDLFGRGPYVGKGIYDVEAFERAVGDRFPDNRILSHDLIEGSFARCGYVNDVELIEEHPTQYVEDARRRHRWIRGDWQIARWLLPRAPRADGTSQPNAIEALWRWMIFDNLRRSLVAPALLALLVAGWLGLADRVWAWTGALAALYLLGELPGLVWAWMAKGRKIAWAGHLRQTTIQHGRPWAIKLLHLALLPYETVLGLDAIVRVAWRTLVSRRRLLQWQSPLNHGRSDGLAVVLRKMWASPAAVLLTGAALFVVRPGALPDAAILLCVWLFGPAAVWYLSRPLRPRLQPLSETDRSFLGQIARRTWAYFEQFVGDDDHWLPPDNYQEQPQGKLARRTSPTNIGLYLLSNLSAWDLGFLTAGGLIDRTRKTFANMDRLERYRGHLYNWYDTETCRILRPAYVSSVDSGNLACSMVVLGSGLAESIDSPILPPAWRRGLLNAAEVLRTEIRRAQDHASNDQARARLEAAWRTIGEQLERAAPAWPGSPNATGRVRGTPDRPPLGQVREFLRQWSAWTAALEPLAEHDGDVAFWLSSLKRQLAALTDELAELTPWAGQRGAVLEEAARLVARVGGEPGAAQSAWRTICDPLERMPSLRRLAGLASDLAKPLRDLRARAGEQSPLGRTLAEVQRMVAEASNRAGRRIADLEELVELCREQADLPWDFLYDPARKLLQIGYSVEDRRPDPGYYDLLASEARAASFLGIAQGKLPEEHWFMLNRRLASVNGAVTLASWSGSMFEYLMPMLFMPSFEGTLLDWACRSAAMLQVRHGRRMGVPWGVSESGFNQIDSHMNYQYRAFGIPGLGLKRGLADDLVVAPYASAMALAVLPRRACRNLRELAGLGLLRRYGFYEAADYTASRVLRGREHATVQSFMAHHSGMSLLGLDFALTGPVMPRRFLAHAEVKAAALLLQERVPTARVTRPPFAPAAEQPEAIKPPETVVRVFTSPDTDTPQVHLLSNGRYHVMLTASGSGYSRWGAQPRAAGIADPWHDWALTRWHEDFTCDGGGHYLYVTDVRDGQSWSCSHLAMAGGPKGEPSPGAPPAKAVRREAIFSQARAEYRLTANEVASHLTVAVSPEDDVEVRRLVLTNLSSHRKVLELTSLAEVALAQPRAWAAHPVFQSLFVQTRVLPDAAGVLCARRSAAAGPPTPWMFHALSVHGAGPSATVSFETDRGVFLGRTRSPDSPAALDRPGPLSNSHGSVLDPCVAARVRLTLAPGEAVTVDVLTGAAEQEDQAVRLLGAYRDPRRADRVFELAATRSQVTLSQLHMSEADAQLYLRMAGGILFASPSHRASPSLIARNRRSQSDLWRHGISGDLPIVLVRVTERSGLDLVRSLVQAYAYWRDKGLRVDLVLWADAFAGYRQSLLDEVTGLVNLAGEGKNLNRHGGIYIRGTDQLPPDDQSLLQAAARIVLSDRAGGISDQLLRRGRSEAVTPTLRPARQAEPIRPEEFELPPRELTFFNGLGGFTPDGREYVAVLREDRAGADAETPQSPAPVTPAPWCNVLANARFGSVVTESGGGYTWFDNAHEFRISPWYNDPVRDVSGECFYIRDEETGRFWSPTPLPCRGPTPYVSRHGLGYSVFEHTQDGIFSEMQVYVASDAPAKLFLFTLRNTADRVRRLSLSGMVELVLGEQRDLSGPHVVSRIDPRSGALFASNCHNNDFSGKVVFFHCTESDRSFTANRTEFIGRNRSLARPQAMSRRRLSNRVGAGLDPCAAIQAFVTIPPGQERAVAFVLGAGDDEGQARDVLNRYRDVGEARHALEQVWGFWNHLLGGVYVETPDPAVNHLANHWLLYQTLACRYWGRSGYYQSGGAYGFRDQLQDAAAFLHECPWLTREHLLRAASRQFREGDVQHWWHPPSGRGVRTRFSDDYLWLPWAVCRYVAGTGDTGVLDETAAFLEGRPLHPDEESYYDLPVVSNERADLYEHCRRAIRLGLRFGPHGLPLIGCGDWNDGLNHLGREGKGESVWLAFFLYDVLGDFADLALSRNDSEFAAQCRQAAEQVRGNIEAHAWDGQWYLRAFFDDGQPLGSSASPECRIDSLPQSWSVLSGAAAPERRRQAMRSVLDRLVDSEQKLVKLFEPPFDEAPWDPGYIRGYLPGVRENGGQYTHAAVWVAMALARQRMAQEAWQITSMLLPPNHADSPQAVAGYQVEPYVVAGDVYAAPDHPGRGGWTWYTGSAGWMYRLLIESLLGLRLKVDRLTLSPVLPPGWLDKSYRVHYRYRQALYHITVQVDGPQTWNVRSVVVDGSAREDGQIPLVDDRAEHQVEVHVG